MEEVVELTNTTRISVRDAAEVVHESMRKVHDTALLLNYKSVELLDIIGNKRRCPLTRTYFRAYLTATYNEELCDFLGAVHDYESSFFHEDLETRISPDGKSLTHKEFARNIVESFIAVGSPKEINISSSLRQKVLQDCSLEDPSACISPTVFHPARDEVIRLLKTNGLCEGFIKTMMRNISATGSRKRYVLCAVCTMYTLLIFFGLCVVEHLYAIDFWWGLLIFPFAYVSLLFFFSANKGL